MSALIKLFVLATAFLEGCALMAKLQSQEIDPQFFKDVLQYLPSHSALPPVADLSKGDQGEPPQMRAWDDKFKYMEGFRRLIVDPGIDTSREWLLTTTKETVGNVALPARGCELVIAGKVLSSRATLAYHKLLVYSTYEVEVETVFKPSRKKLPERLSRLKVILFGGGLQFPSGNLTYCLLTGSGFMSVGKRYILFLSKQIKSIEPYGVCGIYLSEDSKVYPMFSDQSTAKYQGMPEAQFEARVVSAVAKNVDR